MYRTHLLIARLSELIYESLGILPSIAGISILERRLFHIWGRAILGVFEKSQTTWRSKWAGFLKLHGITSANYEIHHLDHKHQAYIKLSVNHTKAYIGSTTTGLCVREGNRKKEVQRGNKQGGASHTMVEKIRQCLAILPHHHQNVPQRSDGIRVRDRHNSCAKT